MILKCADIGHLTAAPRTHKRWAIQLEEEFFRQASLNAMHPWMHIASYLCSLRASAVPM